MINVVHVTYDMRIGGTEMVIKQLVEGIDKSEYSVSIFCLQAPLGPWGEELQSKGVDIYKYDWQSGIDLGAIKALRRFLKDKQADIVHCHQYTPWFYGALATLGTSMKVIFTEHGRFYPDVKSPKRRFINPLLLKLTDCVTAISQATADALDTFEYIPRDKVNVIYNGIAEELPEVPDNIRDELPIDDETIVLGTIARLDPIKNHFMMLRSLKSLIDKGHNVHLLLVGDGELKEQLEAQIKKLDLTTHVTMPGYKSAPFAYLDAMDIFLLTSFSEGTSMTLLEAMRAGKPCIVTDVGGNPEVIKDKHNGFVVTSDKDEELTRSIESLIHDASAFKKMQENAKSRFLSTFSAQKMNDSFVSIYQNLIHLQRAYR